MTDNSKEAYMSEIKPVYQRRIQDDDWQEIEHSEYMEFSERGKFQTRILYPSAALEALQKQNNALKLMCESKANQLTIIDKEVTRLRSLDTDNKGLKECNAILTEEHAAQAKRIAEHLELIEATAEFSKAFWEKADKHRDTRVMVSTFQQLEQKLRTYIPKN